MYFVLPNFKTSHVPVRGFPARMSNGQQMYLHTFASGSQTQAHVMFLGWDLFFLRHVKHSMAPISLVSCYILASAGWCIHNRWCVLRLGDFSLCSYIHFALFATCSIFNTWQLACRL